MEALQNGEASAEPAQALDAVLAMQTGPPSPSPVQTPDAAANMLSNIQRHTGWPTANCMLIPEAMQTGHRSTRPAQTANAREGMHSGQHIASRPAAAPEQVSREFWATTLIMTGLEQLATRLVRLEVAQRMEGQDTAGGPEGSQHTDGASLAAAPTWRDQLDGDHSDACMDVDRADQVNNAGAPSHCSTLPDGCGTDHEERVNADDADQNAPVHPDSPEGGPAFSPAIIIPDSDEEDVDNADVDSEPGRYITKRTPHQAEPGSTSLPAPGHTVGGAAL
ncbi:hypothetical protein WJX84_011546 [Apatococcus fuscideae]|uniref:Uncharacterized protein n=1 Tax=Apatococcus fuscideae TaxID=2026836 RepID=A0AAW1SQT7_9CHLO